MKSDQFIKLEKIINSEIKDLKTIRLKSGKDLHHKLSEQYVKNLKSKALKKIRKNSRNRMIFWNRDASHNFWEVKHKFYKDIWSKIRKNSRKIREKPDDSEKIIISYSRYTSSILLKNEKKYWNLKNLRKSGNIRKKSGNRNNFRKNESSYHIWELNYPFCQEIWSISLTYEDLRRWVWKKSKFITSVLSLKK